MSRRQIHVKAGDASARGAAFDLGFCKHPHTCQQTPCTCPASRGLVPVLTVPFGSRGAEGPTTFLLPPEETGLPVASWLKDHFITTLPKARLRSRAPRALSSRRMGEVYLIIRRAFDPDAPWEG
jgi:mRNA-degrading endonuclease toxin of MazEF toxin-antitoxin module